MSEVPLYKFYDTEHHALSVIGDEQVRTSTLPSDHHRALGIVLL